MKLIATALIKAKANFKPILKTKTNPHFRSKYAGLDAILDAITAALGEVGVLLVQPTVVREDKTILRTILIHAESGEQIESELAIPPLLDPQKLGAAMTYYRRFSLCALLAIAPDEDDDGSTANAQAQVKAPLVPASPREAEVRALIGELKLSGADVTELVQQHFQKQIGVMTQPEFRRLLELMRQTANSRLIAR
jgi:ERF superfamily